MSYEDRAESSHARRQLPQWQVDKLRDGKHELLQIPKELTDVFQKPEHEGDRDRLQMARDALARYEPTKR
eukprot:gene49120-26488_t